MLRDPYDRRLPEWQSEEADHPAAIAALETALANLKAALVYLKGGAGVDDPDVLLPVFEAESGLVWFMDYVTPAAQEAAALLLWGRKPIGRIS